MKTFQILKDTQSRLGQEEAQPGGTPDQDQALISDS